MPSHPTEIEMMFLRSMSVAARDTVYKLDYPVCMKMANEAVAIAVQHAPKKTGLGSRGLYPIAEEGVFGIGIHDWAYYMYFQEMGIAPFIMWNLEGKVIPMNINGHIVFRKATHVGEQKRNKLGQYQTGIRWRYPGLEPKNFIKDALDQVMEIHTQDIASIVGTEFLAQKLLEAFSVN